MQIGGWLHAYVCTAIVALKSSTKMLLQCGKDDVVSNSFVRNIMCMRTSWGELPRLASERLYENHLLYVDHVIFDQI